MKKNRKYKYSNHVHTYEQACKYKNISNYTSCKCKYVHTYIFTYTLRFPNYLTVVARAGQQP